LDVATRNSLLTAMLEKLTLSRDDIIAANQLDMADAEVSVKAGSLPKTLYKRLDLSGPKYDALLRGLDAVRSLEDPLNRLTYTQQMTEGLQLYRYTAPIGVVAVIFEARPEAAVQIASLCIKSGNCVVLKGGKEAKHSNHALVAAMRSALPEPLKNAIQLVESREAVADLLKQDKFIDVIIPRGSAELVKYIKQNTTIPVLGHADGICTTYVHSAANFPTALKILIDGKTQYPAVCNATETLLVDRLIAADFLKLAIPALLGRQVTLKMCPESLALVAPCAGLVAAEAADFDTEWCDLTLSVKVVAGLDQAIGHINTHGSHHTDAIATEDEAAAEQFMTRVDSAGVYWNASTRFADGFRYGFGAEVGVSTGKLHARGPMGLEGLTTVKYKLFGNGHTVSEHGQSLNPSHQPIL
jgi:glutamate-5-semialdehyde dehydrogenase